MPRLVVMDSGLPDRGLIDLTRPGLFSGKINIKREVASILAGATKEKPVIELVGFGNTSLPQKPLKNSQVKILTNIWKEAFEAADCRVIVHRVFDAAPGPNTKYRTRTVSV